MKEEVLKHSEDAGKKISRHVLSQISAEIDRLRFVPQSPSKPEAKL
jgi:hypothetical protein